MRCVSPTHAGDVLRGISGDGTIPAGLYYLLLTTERDLETKSLRFPKGTLDDCTDKRQSRYGSIVSRVRRRVNN
jgi:hypothetical protein